MELADFFFAGSVFNRTTPIFGHFRFCCGSAAAAAANPSKVGVFPQFLYHIDDSVSCINDITYFNIGIAKDTHNNLQAPPKRRCGGLGRICPNFKFLSIINILAQIFGYNVSFIFFNSQNLWH